MICAVLLQHTCMKQVITQKALAHEQRCVRSIYNKAEYAQQLSKLLQDWADMVDEWINKYHE